MRLWTVQPKSILDELDTSGVYRCNKSLSYNLSKADSLEEKYQWLISRMESRIGERPSEVEYPIWSWHTWEGERKCPDTNSAAFLKRTEDKVLLTLEVPDADVVLTDFDAWQTVLNNGYLTSETSIEKLEELETFLDSLTEEELDQEIRKSWENVFDLTRINTEELNRGCYIQATFWEIKKEYVVGREILPEFFS